MINNSKLIIFILISAMFLCCEKQSGDNTDDEPTITQAPELKGKLVYHNYTTYETRDSKLWLYDFETDKLICISEDWGIINPMNAHFSPDGKQIVFMGIGSTNSWDIFLYDFEYDDFPVNLTPVGTTRDEDPKFSPDGKRIAFKRDFKIAEMELSTRKVTILSPDDYSMPYYNYDGTKLICSKSDGPTSSIAVIDIAAKEIVTLYDALGVQDYYPINADEKSFYYSAGYLPSNRLDQVYRGYWNGTKSTRLPFNNMDGDYSDAYPVNDDWVIISSTRKGTKGGYDLYVAHVRQDIVFPLTDYNKDINTSKNELGASIFLVK